MLFSISSPSSILFCSKEKKKLLERKEDSKTYSKMKKKDQKIQINKGFNTSA